MLRIQLRKGQAPGHRGLNQQRAPVCSVVCAHVRTRVHVCMYSCMYSTSVCLVKRMGQAVRGGELRRNGRVTVDGVLGKASVKGEMLV